MKWFLFSIVVVLFGSCSFFEENQEKLLSNIDGAEYYAIKDGDMNARKASMFILDGLSDRVSYVAKLDLLDSIESVDVIWRGKYLNSFGVVLKEVYSGDNKDYVEDKVFSFFIHNPQELTDYLNEEGFENIDSWMLVLSRGLVKVIEPDDITINSVANLVISNCVNCDTTKQKLVVDFVSKLEMFNKFED